MFTELKPVLFIALAGAAIFFTPVNAQAGERDYCREYTRTVTIGGRKQDAFGTACLQPNGDWMIVGEGLGNDIPDRVNDVDYVIHDQRRDIVPTRVVYYERHPSYYRSRHRNYAPSFIWYHNGFSRGGAFISYTPHRSYRDYDEHRGRGRGRGHDRNERYEWNHRGGDDDRHNDRRGHYDPRDRAFW